MTDNTDKLTTELLRIVAELPSTPDDVRAQIVNLLGDQPKPEPVKAPEPVKVENISKNFSLTDDERSELKRLTSEYKDAALELENEIDDFNSTLENKWYDVDSARDEYNESVSHLQYFIANIRDRISEADVSDSYIVDSWDEVEPEEWDGYEPDQLDGVDYESTIEALKDLPLSE